jgi:hypothetical protein
METIGQSLSRIGAKKPQDRKGTLDVAAAA